MRFNNLLLLVSATLVGFVIFAEASSSSSEVAKSSEGKGNNEKVRKAVEYANSQTNPLEALKKPSTFVSNDGETMTIECIKGPSLSGELLQWYKRLLDKDSELIKDTITSMGKNSEIRRSTYMKDTTYLLIVRSSAKKPVGITHFKFLTNPTQTHASVYLWDLLVEESDRGRGIGTYLLDTVTDIATHFNMKKTILSVFKSNSRALKLYTERGFSTDENIQETKFSYVLSKPNTSFEE